MSAANKSTLSLTATTTSTSLGGGVTLNTGGSSAAAAKSKEKKQQEEEEEQRPQPQPPPQQRLFDYFLVVSLRRRSGSMSEPSSSSPSSPASLSGGGPLSPFIKYKYPTDKTDSFLTSATEFCFPDTSLFDKDPQPSKDAHSSSSAFGGGGGSGSGGGGAGASEEHEGTSLAATARRAFMLGQQSAKAARNGSFSFVLTDVHGGKRWGYCKRTSLNKLLRRRARTATTSTASSILSSAGSTFSSSFGKKEATDEEQEENALGRKSKRRCCLCFCLISYLPCFDLFSQLLDHLMLSLTQTELPSRLASPLPQVLSDRCLQFLNAVYDQLLPPPGGTLTIVVRDSPAAKQQYSFTRPDDSDSLLSHVSFEPMLQQLSSRNIMLTFLSLLVERRIIFVSNSLGLLSSCIQAFVALLYPFTWQHIFIPVLPPSMLDYCGAPMPFVIGILRSSMQQLMQMTSSMEDVVLVDLDRDSVSYLPPTSPLQDDWELLPPSLTGPLLDYIEYYKKAVQRLRPFPWNAFLHKAKKKGEHFNGGGSSQSKRKLLQQQADEKHQKDPASSKRSSSSSSFTNEEEADNKKLSHAFIAFMIELLASYRLFIVPDKRERDQEKKRSSRRGTRKTSLPHDDDTTTDDSNVTATSESESSDDSSEEKLDGFVGNFDANNFVCSEAVEKQPLLLLLTQTQMFQVFIEERTKQMRRFSSGKFEQGVQTISKAEGRRAILANETSDSNNNNDTSRDIVKHSDNLLSGREREEHNSNDANSGLVTKTGRSPRSRFTLYETGSISKEEITEALEGRDKPKERMDNVKDKEHTQQQHRKERDKEEKKKKRKEAKEEKKKKKKEKNKNKNKKPPKMFLSEAKRQTAKLSQHLKTKRQEMSAKEKISNRRKEIGAAEDYNGGLGEMERPHCPDGEDCHSADPLHWVSYQHTRLRKEGGNAEQQQSQNEVDGEETNRGEKELTSKQQRRHEDGKKEKEKEEEEEEEGEENVHNEKATTTTKEAEQAMPSIVHNFVKILLFLNEYDDDDEAPSKEQSI
ncbi:Rab guanyl-nucleotide exchange factor [Balamuthia mandrillaris]